MNTYLVDIFILWLKHDIYLAQCNKIELCISIDGLMDSSTLIFSKVICTGEYKKLIFSFSTLTYVVGTRKNRFNMIVLLSTQTYVKTDG